MREHKMISLARIRTHGRLRDLDTVWVDALATSIEKNRLQQEITVRPARDIEGDRWGESYPDSFDLVAGYHRVAAVQQLGWEAIPAFIVDPETPADARLLEIDENLIRRELSPLDRAVFLAERRKIWLTLHPETAQGKAGATARWNATATMSVASAGGRQNANDTMSFASETAKRIGISVRSVQRAVELADRLAAVRGRIAGTRLADRQSELIALSKLAPDLQQKVVALLTAPEGRVHTVKAALAQVTGQTPAPETGDEAQYRKLIETWSRAASPARKRFLDELRRRGDL